MSSKDHFQPESEYSEDFENSRIFYRIEPDGAVVKLVRLHVVNDREREDIICMHFLRYYLPLKYKKDCGVDFLSRDNPWDFKIQIDKDEIFNIEITAIADNENLFRLESDEAKLSLAGRSSIDSRMMAKKVSSAFPFQEHDLSGDDSEGDQYFGRKFLTLSSIPPPSAGYADLLLGAIKSKEDKRHGQKGKTILIIDDRTSAFTKEEITRSIDSLEITCSFEQVWIYIGYYGSAQGAAGYTLINIMSV